jgi:hypothetical protein
LLTVKGILATITAVVVLAKAVTSLIDQVGKLQNKSTA